MTMASDDDKFTEWVTKTVTIFKSMSNEKRNKTFDSLIENSEASQLFYLSEKLNRLLKRDFMVQLPSELAFYLLRYIDSETLITCLYVSKGWYARIMSCLEVWKKACERIGIAESALQDNSSPPFFKDLFMLSKARLKSLREGTAFKTKLLYGHSDRVMAVYYYNGRLGTGSDDHSVRIWDCETGACLKVIQTHTVADLKFDNERVFTASFDTTAACWDMDSGTSVCHYKGHVAAVFSLDYNSKLDILVTGSADSTVKIWCLSSAVMLRTLTQHRSAWITQVRLYYPKTDGTHTLDINSPTLSQVYHICSRDNGSVHSWKLNDKHEIMESEEWQDPYNDLVPGLQVMGPTVFFGTRDTFNTCYVVKTPIYRIKDITTRVSYEVPRDEYVQAFLGSGVQFDVLLLDGDQCPSVHIVRHKTQHLVTAMSIPSHYRPSKRGSTYTIGEKAWLHGLQSQNDNSVFFATSMRDHSICLLLWKKFINSTQAEETTESQRECHSNSEEES